MKKFTSIKVFLVLIILVSCSKEKSEYGDNLPIQAKFFIQSIDSLQVIESYNSYYKKIQSDTFVYFTVYNASSGPIKRLVGHYILYNDYDYNTTDSTEIFANTSIEFNEYGLPITPKATIRANLTTLKSYYLDMSLFYGTANYVSYFRIRVDIRKYKHDFLLHNVQIISNYIVSQDF